MEKQLIDFFYKWHRFEKHNGVTIIDFDLLQQDISSKEFQSREEILNELLRLIDKYNKFPDKNIFVEAKLEASVYYLYALMGKSIPFKQYIEKTMGITPKYIPEKDLTQQLEKIKQSFQEVGYKWGKEGIKRFQKENLLSKEEIESNFRHFRDINITKVLTWLGLEIELKYKVSFVELDEYWMNWISTDEKGEILLRYNLHKRHKWLKGSTEFLVFHEICAHALQASLWKEQIKKGMMSPFIGLTTVFTPEQFFFEGIAESLFYFYPTNPFYDYGLVSLRWDHLNWFVWNNAHIMANENKKIKNIIEFVQMYLPYLTEKEIKKSVQEKTKDPLARTYQYIYGVALYYHKLIAEKLNQKEKKAYVLDIYNNIYTPTGILQKYNLS